MKFLLIILLALASCGRLPKGKDGKGGSDGVDGTTGETGPQGETGRDGKDFTPTANVSLEGYWMLPDGGYLELIDNNDNAILINGTQRIYSTNTDGSLGLFPSLAIGPYVVHDGVIRTEYNSTLVAVSNNVYVLATNVQIVGTRKTVATFSLNSGNKLVINIKVYGASGLTIEADRTIVSQ